jgi:DNA polymerase III delta subunit
LGGISEDLVRTHVRDQAQAWVYDLTNAISARRLDQAQPLLERLLGQGEPPLRLLATLATHVGDLTAAAGALANVPRSALQASPGAFAKGVYPRMPEAFRARFKSGFRAYYVLKGASAFRPAELRRLHRELVELDLKLKSSSLAPTHLFAAFILAACGAGRRAAQLS